MAKYRQIDAYLLSNIVSISSHSQINRLFRITAHSTNFPIIKTLLQSAELMNKSEIEGENLK